MAEEHRFESQEGHRLCANNCGFFGSPATLNLCSKCFRDHTMKEEQASSVKIAVENSLSASSSSSSSLPAHMSIPAAEDHRSNSLIVLADAAMSDLPAQEEAMISESTQTATNRCSSCRKRVGLTGFRCRCGVTFCSMHRYPEKHGCTFDFKAVGREAIAKANPVVKGEKLQRI